MAPEGRVRGQFAAQRGRLAHLYSLEFVQRIRPSYPERGFQFGESIFQLTHHCGDLFHDLRALLADTGRFPNGRVADLVHGNPNRRHRPPVSFDNCAI